MKKLYIAAIFIIVVLPSCSPLSVNGYETELPELITKPPAKFTTEAPPEQNSIVQTPAVNQLIQLTQQDLAGKLNVKADLIGKPDVIPVTWSDTSLGCPQPGVMYAQVMTEGYKLTYTIKGQQFIYHTDTASRFVHCVE